MSSIMRHIGCDRRWLAVSSVGLMAISGFTETASAALTYSLNYGQTSSSTVLSNERSQWDSRNRADWVAAGSGSATRITDDFSTITEWGGSTQLSTLAQAVSVEAAATSSFPTPTNGAAAPVLNQWSPTGGGSGTRFAFDAGNTKIEYTATRGTTAPTLTLGTGSHFSTGNYLNVSNGGGYWSWLRFTPDTPVSGFGVDFWNTFSHDNSDVGFFSWRLTFENNTQVLGRVVSKAGPLLPAGTNDLKSTQDFNAGWYNDYIAVPTAAVPSFLGVRSDSQKITSVEFFSQHNGTTFSVDNFTAEVVPEPSSLALLGIAGLGLAGAWVRRKR